MIYLLSVAAFGGLLVGLSAVLIVAERHLVNYGECKITITQNNEKQEFAVQGGGYLLPALLDNKINISSSCGGKGNCGYCKVRVLSGGGQLLPTEEAFMTREEKREGKRLACRVKIKNDIEIHIPDFLATVRGIVKNRLYNPNLKWRFTLAREREDGIVSEGRVLKKISVGEKARADEIIERFRGKKGGLVPLLEEINARHNYFPENVLWHVSQELDVPLSVVFRVATFYNAFSLTPKGKNIIKVCLGTACYVKGGERILATVENVLGVAAGETTKDNVFTIDTVSCIGCCGQSPVMSVNGDIYGYLRPGMIEGILRKYS